MNALRGTAEGLYDLYLVLAKMKLKAIGNGKVFYLFQRTNVDGRKGMKVEKREENGDWSASCIQMSRYHVMNGKRMRVCVSGCVMITGYAEVHCRG